MAEEGTPPTATRLCENAGISRNALYRYHSDVLLELHKLQHQRYRQPTPAKRRLDQLQSDNDALNLQMAQLAALVDHYFAAWQEASTLLKRREKELSELRRAHSSKVVSMRK
jgi:predicted site-specific integrase-resolvase